MQALFFVRFRRWQNFWCFAASVLGEERIFDDLQPVGVR